jgi:RHS repeat-associated protein
MTKPAHGASPRLAGFSPSRPRRSPDHPVRCRDRVGGHHHRSSNPRRGSHPHGPGSRRASQWYRCRSAARKRPPGLRFGVGYRCYLKLGARYYNPTTARFTQPDPSGQEPNNYNYASCNPANYTDPTGFGSCSTTNIVKTFIGLGIATLTFPEGPTIAAGAAAVMGVNYVMMIDGMVRTASDCPVAENNPGRRGSMEPAMP